MIHSIEFMKNNYNCVVKLKRGNLILLEPRKEEQQSANNIINNLYNRDIENIIVCGFTTDNLPFFSFSYMPKTTLSLILFNVQEYIKDCILE